MKRKRRNLIYLSDLYLSHIINKVNLIIITIGIILFFIGIYFISDPWLKTADYLLRKDEYHYIYLKQCLLIVTLFNLIMITTIIISLGSNCDNMDMMYVSYISRRSICIAKLIVIFLFGFLLILIELFGISSIEYLRYDKFVFGYKYFLGFCYVFISYLFQAILGMAIVSISHSIFLPLGYLFLQVLYFIVFTNNSLIMDKIGNFIPWIDVGKDGIIVINNIIPSIIWIILLIFLYICIYNIKDLKNQ